MPDDIESIHAIRTQTLAIIAELTASPKPTYSIDGQTVSWSAYLGRLQQTIDWCDRKLATDQPIEIETRGTSP